MGNLKVIQGGKFALTHEQELTQNDIVESFKRGINILMLQGRAGTGKSTLVRSLVDLLGVDYEVISTCATHTAAQVNNAQTTAKALKLILNDKDKLEAVTTLPDLSNTIYILDEGVSLGNDYLGRIKEALAQGARFLVVGDTNQLPPVGLNYFPILKLINERNIYTLEQLMRQSKSNPLGKFCNAIADVAEGKTSTYPKLKTDVNKIGQGLIHLPQQEFYAQAINGFDGEHLNSFQPQNAVITYDNKTANSAAEYLRENILGITGIQTGTRLVTTTHTTKFNPSRTSKFNEKSLRSNSNITVFEILKEGSLASIPVKHCHVLTEQGEGDIYLVDSISPREYKEHIANWWREFKTKPGLKDSSKAEYRELCQLTYNACCVRYPFAMTAHKAQGKTFTDTYISFDGFAKSSASKAFTLPRLLYVAASRASNAVYCTGASLDNRQGL